jgi:2'-5' RNA ligase
MAANWFIALPVPAGPWLEALQPPPGVRLFAREDLHLTVAFLGPVSAERARAAFDHAGALPLRPLEIGLAQVAALGSPRRPSAFSALLDQGRAEVERAIGALRDVLCDAAGAAREHRPPLAHVTLARPARTLTAEQLRAARAWAGDVSLAGTHAHVTRVALFTRSEAPSGAPGQARSPAAARFRVDREHPLAS